jgi:hypothetical protein
VTEREIEEKQMETDKLDWCIAFCKQFASVSQQDIPSEASAQLAALTEQQAEAVAQAYRKCAKSACSGLLSHGQMANLFVEWADESVKEAGR